MFCFLNIQYVVGHNEPLTCSSNGSIITQWVIMLCGLSILALLGICINTIINYYQLQNVISIIQSSTKQILKLNMNNIETKKHKEMEDLANFVPLKPYKFININPQSLPIVVDELITEAKQTKKFTCVCLNNVLEVEFIQESQSIITHIEISEDYTGLYKKIRELFLAIFDLSNTIQAWGNIYYNLVDYEDYPFYLYENFNKIQFVNIIEHFTIWYNGTFPHNESCSQILHFIDTDGPLCSCAHRPCKSLGDNWSIWMAIAYTFDENLHKGNDNRYACLAITKLAMIIQEKWSRQQVIDYIREHHFGQKDA
ncbi:unnamed protein product [Rotaria sordida]|uniref:Uncharacterized protein n=1 Tax=Rotaria sordida TaxID=392033 RepID=A0A819XCM4_9BILA|nr:unnamed protein product [Rotaria sordida]